MQLELLSAPHWMWWETQMHAKIINRLHSTLLSQEFTEFKYFIFNVDITRFRKPQGHTEHTGAFSLQKTEANIENGDNMPLCKMRTENE